MKFITIFLLIATQAFWASGEDFISGGIYIKAAAENQAVKWTGQSGNDIATLKIGRTYSVENKSFDLQTTNQEAILQLSSGLLIQTAPGSEFRVDTFNQMITDAASEPESLKVGDFILNTALMNGSAYVSAPKYTSSNTLCMLQTPLMNLDLNGGKYHIKTSQKFTFIYVLEGTIGIFDNQSNTKSIESAGTMVLIFPSPMKATETMVTEKSISSEELLKMSAVLQKMETGAPKVSFVVIAGKIVGVKLN